MTAGALLLRAAAKAGYYGLFTRLAGAQVRGGEAAALLTLATRHVESPPDTYDALVAVDWGNVERFAGSIPLRSDSFVVCDPKHGAVPPAIAAAGAREVLIDFAALAKVPGGRPNMVALGAVAAALGLPDRIVTAIATERLASIGDLAVAGAHACLGFGRAASEPIHSLQLAPPLAAGRGRWLVSGNQALALGALRGGLRFAAGYPITPATEVAEWLVPVLERIGGTFVQAEDELAALNLCLGASYGGAPAMTVTSGPGMSLMVETLGLAVQAEIPVLLVDVQRCGPSTGIASQSEQSDLNLAVYGAHGDAPRVVVAPTSAEDGLPTAQWAMELAEALQSPVILLSDQQMGQAELVMDAPASAPAPRPRREVARAGEAPYKRYAITASGVSPIAAPGTPGCAWIAESLTHAESSAASGAARDHVAQIEKRARKLESHAYGERWGDVEGEGDIAVIAWGSSVAPAREAIARLGARIRLVAPRLLAPLPVKELDHALRGVRRALVVEQNHGAQLHRYLRSRLSEPSILHSLARPGPAPLRPAELQKGISAWMLR